MIKAQNKQKGDEKMRHVTIKNYQQALDYLGGKKERPYAHNTRIEVCEHGIEAKYHGSTIALFTEEYNVYSSCGWKTSTTKERINWFLPEGFYLYQERSVWYLARRNTATMSYANNAGIFVFADGIAVKNGEVYNAGQDDGEVKRTIKAIKKYVDGYVKALLSGEVDKPSGGDCWYCAMAVSEGKDKGKSLGDATGDTSHILSHFEEEYFVPSMLMNAEKHNHHLSTFAKDGIARLWEGMEVSDWQKEITGEQVKSCLTSYLKHVLGLAQ